MTDKKTALATLTEFFTHIGSERPRIDDAWDDYGLVSASKYIGTKCYTVTALVHDKALQTVSVVVYDFGEQSKREVVFRVESLPAMAAKFVLEAIDAYGADQESSHQGDHND